MRPQAGLADRMLAAVAVSGVGYAALLLSSVVTARLLGVEGRGSFVYFQTVAAGLSVVALLGIGHGQMFYAAAEPRLLRHFVPNAALLSVVLGGGSAALYLAWLGRPQTLGHSPAWHGLAQWLVIAVPVVSMLSFQRQFLLACHAYVLSKANLATAQTLPLLGFGLAYLLGRTSTESFVAILVTSQLVSLILFHWISRRVVPEPWSVSADLVKDSARFGIWQYLSDLALFLTMRLDFLLVGWWLGERGLGIYSIAVALAEIVSRIPSELGTMLFPAFAAGRVKRDDGATLLRLLWTSSMGVAVVLFVLANPLVRLLFGEQYSEVVPAFRCLLFGTVAWSTIFVTWNHASARGAPAVGVPVFASAALLDVILNVLLLPRIGVVGASLAAAASYWLAALLFLLRFCRVEGYSLVDCIVPRRTDLALILTQMTSLLRRSDAPD